MTRKQSTRLLLLVFCLSVLGMVQTFAQIEVEPALSDPRSPENLIREVFAGKGIDIISVNFVGDKNALGYFKNGTADVGIPEGFMMSTGRAALAATPNLNDGDGQPLQVTDQEPLISGLALGELVQDLAMYEIEFVPKRDTIEFKYVFASEEYPEFGCNCFNDVFGFFLQGPGYTDWTNLAIVPGTLDEPVSVRSIHPLDDIDNRTDPCNNGAPRPDCAATNEHLYVDNKGSTTLTYDGLTTVLTAKTKVEPCQTYKIKLAIADVGDALFDSAIFFDANSFGTDELEVKMALESIDGTLIEGCAGGQITFSFDKPVPRNYRINFTGSVVRDNPNIDGDYTLEPLQDFIAKGETSLTLNIRPLIDPVDEGLDSLGFMVDINDCETETYWFYFRENELEKVDLGEDGSICPGDSMQLDGKPDIILPVERSFTSPSDNIDIKTIDENGTSPDTEPTVSTITVTDVQPADIRDGLIKEVCVNVGHNNIEDIDLILESPSGQLLELSTDNGGADRNYTATCFSPDAMTLITDGTAPFTGSFQPEGDWEILNDGETNGDWKLYAKDDKTGDDGVLRNWSITFNPLYDLHYSWTPTEGLSCSDCPNPKAAPNVETEYILAVTDSYGCIVRDSVLIKTNNDTLDIAATCIEETQNSITFGWETSSDVTSYEVNIDGQGWITPSGIGAHTVTNLAEGAVVNLQVRGTGPCVNVKGAVECMTSVCFPPDASIDRIIDLTCAGADDGRIDLLSDEPNVVFILDQDTSFTKRFSNLSAGDYEIIALDTATTCTIKLDATIGAPDSIKIDTFAIDASCGGVDGLAAISITGGTTPYNILWTIGVAEDTIRNQAPGVYTVQVKDDFDCEVTQTVTIGEDKTPTTSGINIFCAETTSTSVTFEWDPVPGISQYEVQIGEDAWKDPTSSTSILVSNLNILEDVQIRVRGASDCITALDSMTCMTTDCTPPTGSFDLVSAGACMDYTDGALSIASASPNLVYILNTDTSLIGQFDNLSPGDYRVELYDTLTACNKYIDTTLINHVLLEVDTFKTIASCGMDDGIAAVTPTGGTAPYNILWSNGMDTDTIQGMSPGTYNVVVTDAIGCEVNLSVTIEGDITPTEISIPITCAETTSSSVTFAWDPIQGIDLYEVQIGDDAWSAPSEDTSITVADLAVLESVQIRVRASSQCFVALDSMTCMAEDCIIPTGDFDVVRAGLCSDYTDGVLSVFSTNFNLVYILGTDTSTTGIFTDLPPGDYSIELLDTLTACTNTIDTVLFNPLPLNIELFNQSENCGETDGVAAVSVTGGEGPYQIVWNNGETTDTIKNLSAETYTASIIDSRGCSTTRDIIVDLTIDNLTDLRVQVSCPRITNNSIDVSWKEIPTVSDYEVQVNNGDWTSPNAVGFAHQLRDLGFSEVFDIKVRGNSDCGGAVIGNQICATTTCLPLIAGPPVMAKDVSCNGMNDGELNVTINTSPFNTPTTLPFVVRDSAGFNVIDYSQDSTILLVSATSGYVIVEEDTLRATELNPMVTFRDLEPGIKTIEFWDSTFSCNSTQQITIAEPDTLGIITNFIGGVSCAGLTDGVFASSVLGGAGPYEYTLNGVSTNSEIHPALTAGDYEFVIKDANGCEVKESFTIEDAPVLIDTTYQQNLGCGETDSGVAGIVTSFAGNYQVTWDNGTNGDTISNLSPGMYKGFITTDAGCTDSVELAITDVDYTLEIGRINPLCGNVNDPNSVITAGAYVTAIGNPLGDYSYEWSDPNSQTTDTAFALTPGDYTVTVTDNTTGCSKEEMVFIVAPDVITVNNIRTEETCIGLGDGSVIFDIQGGVPGYSYDWGDNFFRTDPGRSDLNAGDYVVTITDQNGCTVENSFTITAPENIAINFTVDSISCANPTGSATAIVTGGTGNFSYLWNDDNNQTSITATNLTESTFELIVTDENTGCNETASVAIGTIPPVVINTSSTASFCSESATGTASVNITGGSGNYRILWDDPLAQETATAENLNAGDYMVLVIDDSGCEESQQVTVAEEANSMEVNFNVQNITCNGTANGMAEVMVTGNGGNYTYTWSTGSQSRSLENLPGGEYMVTVSDDNGCSSVETITIEEPEFLAGVIEAQPISCKGENDGQIEILAEGGTAPFTYSINGSTFSESQNFPDLRENIYQVSIKDSNGCEVDLGTVNIEEPEEINVVLDRQLIAQSGSPISLDSEVQNAQGEISYSWESDGEQASIICDDCDSPLVSPSYGQAYTVTVTDEMGCTATSTVNLLVRQTRGINVPSGFSPNEDGYNDLLTVHGTEGTQILSFQLFDRWGELVYQNNNFLVNERSIGWDGTHRGNAMNGGVFTWVAEVQYLDGVTEIVKGHTTLIK